MSLKNHLKSFKAKKSFNVLVKGISNTRIKPNASP